MGEGLRLSHWGCIRDAKAGQGSSKTPCEESPIHVWNQLASERVTGDT